MLGKFQLWVLTYQAFNQTVVFKLQQGISLMDIYQQMGFNLWSKKDGDKICLLS